MSRDQVLTEEQWAVIEPLLPSSKGAVVAAILAALGTSWATTASHYLPLAAGRAMFAHRPSDLGTLSPEGRAPSRCWSGYSSP